MVFDAEQLQAVLFQLDQAIANHDQWFKQLTRSLVCKLPPDKPDLLTKPHRHCRFGQWLYHDAPPAFRRLAAYPAIENVHRQMHTQASALLQHRASDHDATPRNYDRFSASLERLRFELLSVRRELEETLHTSDPLTGVRNRLGLLAHLREQQHLVKRGVQPSSIAMLDIDHFKQINDTYGHQSGDQVLSTIGRYLLVHLRPYDHAFRYGGEEFLISLPCTELRMGYQVAERVRHGIADAIADSSFPVKVTVSCGVAQLEGDVPVETTLDGADQALYAAKEAGRNRTCLWQGSTDGGVTCAP